MNSDPDKYCTHCGHQTVPGARFCTACSNPFDRDEIRKEHPEDRVPIRLIIRNEWEDINGPGPISCRIFLIFKWLLVIPLYVSGGFYGIAAYIATFLAFWAILFTGRYPKGLFDFVTEYLQFLARIYAYYPLLMTNHWSPDQNHPVSLEVDVATTPYSRLALIFLKLPSFLFEIVFTLASFAFLILIIMAVPIWFIIMITGRYPARWFQINARMLEWKFRLTGWQFLLRDDASLFGTSALTKAVAWLVIAGLIYVAVVVVFGCPFDGCVG